MLVRVLIVAPLLVVVHLCMQWVPNKFQDVTVESPTFDVEELPMQLGEWAGQDVELDPRLFAALNARSALNRVYQPKQGDPASVHVALWDEGMPSTQHIPTLCYANSGWTMEGDPKIVDMPDSSGQAMLIIFNRESARVAILYWYQLGEAMFLDHDGARSATRGVWTSSTRPPVVKVLLQVPGNDLEEAEKQLIELGGEIRGWTINLKPASQT